MNWPADGQPRYFAASVGGTGGPGMDYVHPSGYVYDRGRCHAIVAKLSDRVQGIALRRAEASAAILNAGGTLAPEQIEGRPHGCSRYRQDRCRCGVCREAMAEYNRVLREAKQASA